jgi:membrane-associated protein
MIMLPGIDLTELIRAVGVLGVMAIIFAESGLLLGFFLPGDTLLFSAGFLATKDVFGVSVHVLVLYLVVAAILGEVVGYWFGRKVGHRIFRRKDSLLFHPDNLVRAERFYEKYGPVTILLARFVPIVRTFVPIVAGAAKMNQRIFTIYNVLGAVLWVAAITYIGYFAGDFLESRGINIDNFILPIIALVTLLTMGSPIIHILKDKDSRSQLLQKLRRR